MTSWVAKALSGLDEAETKEFLRCIEAKQADMGYDRGKFVFVLYFSSRDLPLTAFFPFIPAICRCLLPFSRPFPLFPTHFLSFALFHPLPFTLFRLLPRTFGINSSH